MQQKQQKQTNEQDQVRQVNNTAKQHILFVSQISHQSVCYLLSVSLCVCVCQSFSSSALGVSLSSILFQPLEADVQQISEMEKQVNEAIKAQTEKNKQKEQMNRNTNNNNMMMTNTHSADTPGRSLHYQSQFDEVPHSPYAVEPLILSNLTVKHTTYINRRQLTATTAIFSLFVVQAAANADTNTEDEANHYSFITQYIRPAAPFFGSSYLPSPVRQQRHVITDDWESVSQLKLNGSITHSAMTADQQWMVNAVHRTHQGSEGLEYDLFLSVVHFPPSAPLLADTADSPLLVDLQYQQLTIPLFGHQPITALAILPSLDSSTSSSDNSNSITIILSRHGDRRLFRSIEVTAKNSDNDLSYSDQPPGPRLNEPIIGQSDVTHLLPFNHCLSACAATNTSLDILVVDYDEDREGAPFNSAIYSLQNSQHSDNHSNDTGSDIGNNSEDEEQIDEASASSPVTPSVVSVSPWSRVSVVPSYRRSVARHSSSLLSASSDNLHFLAFSSVPFLTSIDPAHKYDPIELIHLHPDTVFTAITIAEQGQLFIIADQQQDCIILHRSFTVKQNKHHNSNNTNSSSSSNETQTLPVSVHAGHWEVLMELIFPPYLRRLKISSMKIMHIQRMNTETITGEATTATEEQERTSVENNEYQNAANVDDKDEGADAGNESGEPLSVSSQWSDSYLLVLFETGVLASFDLGLPILTPTDVEGFSSDTQQTSNEQRNKDLTASFTTAAMEILGEVFWSKHQTTTDRHGAAEHRSD